MSQGGDDTIIRKFHSTLGIKTIQFSLSDRVGEWYCSDYKTLLDL